ncbi:MAG TPA: VOC family protein [Planctomycetota bacterium]|nr:VOC family protein [Planctomycetota bacterium]
MGQFRFCYFTPIYGETVAFYRDGLEFPLIEAWDRGPEDCGTLFRAAAGIVEVVARPTAPTAHLWDERPPQGAMIVVEVDDVDAVHHRAMAKKLWVTQGLTNQSWGHRSFCLREPNGLTLYLFSELSRRSV